jgi:hypothetical protein
LPANDGPVETPIAITGLDVVECRNCTILSVNMNTLTVRCELLSGQRAVCS